ncbi:MAG TPA: UDP-N-acetylglucosamine 4,6-dehydratase (inverting) [Dehalococcoidia bacterium]|nr:UDP-N-acetylglucosamine 4,6-dehydratase (inverting) [Dehalococcoidia bacterium]
MSIFADQSVLITGGTGSFGSSLTRYLLEHASPRRLIIFSRDEFKQSEMQKKFEHSSLRFFLGDVRDRDRLRTAFHGVDYVVHAAAMKQVPAAEYNPFEAVKTNILGAQNIIETAIEAGVKRVIALSTDKAANPINLYGATKLCSDKLFIAGNSYAGGQVTRFAVVRYGNVLNSRGSVVPLFKSLRETNKLPITDKRMTRFFVTLDHATQFVADCMDRMHGGEVFIPKIPSVRITDLAAVIAPGCEIEETGIRPGEKLHELLIGSDDARQAIDMGDHYILKPQYPMWGQDHTPHEGKPLPDGFIYSSDTNDHWLEGQEILDLVGE